MDRRELAFHARRQQKSLQKKLFAHADQNGQRADETDQTPEGHANREQLQVAVCISKSQRFSHQWQVRGRLKPHTQRQIRSVALRLVLWVTLLTVSLDAPPQASTVLAGRPSSGCV